MPIGARRGYHDGREGLLERFSLGKHPLGPTPDALTPDEVVQPAMVAVLLGWSGAEFRRVSVRVAAALLMPALALVAGKLFSLGQPPTFDARQIAYQAYVGSLPGRDDLWWLDDEQTYFLVPPIRHQIIQEHLLGDLGAVEAQGISSSNGFAKKLAGLLFEVGGDGGRRLSRKVVRDPRLGEVVEVLAPSMKDAQGIENRLQACLDLYPARDRASDMHLRALLLHKLAETGVQPPHSVQPEDGSPAGSYTELAEEAYRKALSLYAWYEPGMAALCGADFGRFLNGQGRSDEAEEQFQRSASRVWSTIDVRGGAVHEAKVRRIAEPAVSSNLPSTWHPFLVSLHAQLAAMYRKNGLWSQAETELNCAAELVGLDKVPTNSLHAYVLERKGWYLMDRWLVKEAAENFAFAEEFRRRESQTDRDGDARSLELAYHNRHGQAMAARYMGDADEACRQYEQIISELRNLLNADSPWFEAARRTLQERLLNSCERLADCFLFSSQDYSRAQDWLEVALEDAEQRIQLSEPGEDLVARLYFKKALAAVLSDKLEDGWLFFRKAQELAPKSGDAPAPASTRIAAKTGAGSDSTKSRGTLLEPLAPLKSHVLQYIRNVVLAYIEYRAHGRTIDATYSHLRDEFIQLARKNRISRDELDLIMLVARHLPAPSLVQAPDGSPLDAAPQISPSTLRQIAQFNVALAGLPQLGEQNDSILRYVSGSYEHAKKLHPAVVRHLPASEVPEESPSGIPTAILPSEPLEAIKEIKP